MDFGALPPEINSTRIYAGPGSAPMLAAAAAWAGLAAELNSTATSYQAVLSGLISESWVGPASVSMAAAAASFVTWMSSTGALAGWTSTQAAAAAAAYEAVFAMTVHPTEVAANRAQLMTLVATNFLGQNSVAIAATEAFYGEMWAQDAGAMYGYAGNSAAAVTLTPFTQPEQNTNPAGLVDQATTVAQAVSTAAGTGAQATIDQLMSAVPTVLQGFASPVSSALGFPGGANSALAVAPEDILANILNFLDGNDGNPYGVFFNSSLVNGFTSAGYVNPGVISPAVTSALTDINSVASSGLSTITPSVGGGAAGWTTLMTPSLPGAGGVVAGANEAALVGRLSVPQSWTAATQVTNHAGAAFPGGGWTTVATGPGGVAGLPGVPGMPAAGNYGHSFGNGPRYGFRPTIMARPPAAG